MFVLGLGCGSGWVGIGIEDGRNSGICPHRLRLFSACFPCRQKPQPSGSPEVAAAAVASSQEVASSVAREASAVVPVASPGASSPGLSAVASPPQVGGGQPQPWPARSEFLHEY